MRSAWPASVGALFVIALTISLFVREDPLEYTPTSHGTLPNAYGALHDLFAELDAPVERSFAPPMRLPAAATVWWIDPDRVCSKLASEPDDSAEEEDGFSERIAGWDPAQWIRGGGTAVIFASALAECTRATRVGGLALPEADRSGFLHEGDEEEDCEIEGHDHSQARADDAVDDPFEGAFGGIDVRVEWPAQEVTGRFLETPRLLPLPTLTTFDTVPDPFEVIARADGAPFAIEAPLGEGRLVLVADAVFLRNAWLDAGDAAPLAFDLVRAYGVPRLDEREHGLSDTPSTTAYLARSPALPVFAGIAATGLLFGWGGASLPRRRVGESIPTPPTLRTYIDSLARLYSRAGQHDEVFDRYREHALAKLRGALRLAHDAPVPRVQEVLRRHGFDASDIDVLDASFRADRQSLVRSCAAVDRLIEATR